MVMMCRKAGCRYQVRQPAKSMTMVMMCRRALSGATTSDRHQASKYSEQTRQDAPEALL